MTKDLWYYSILPEIKVGKSIKKASLMVTFNQEDKNIEIVLGKFSYMQEAEKCVDADLLSRFGIIYKKEKPNFGNSPAKKVDFEKLYKP